MADGHASSVRKSVESDGGGGSSIQSLDECPHSIATAAITDVIITSGSDIPPRGYYRAFPLGEESNKNSHKHPRLYLSVKKEPNWERAEQRPCVTAFCVIFPERNEFIPPGFHVVRLLQTNLVSHESGKKKKKGGGGVTKTSEHGLPESPAANINPSSMGERIYICYRRSWEGNPITGVVCLRPTKGDLVPEGYTVLERMPKFLGRFGCGTRFTRGSSKGKKMHLGKRFFLRILNIMGFRYSGRKNVSQEPHFLSSVDIRGIL
jgi:hypothetical protein